MNKDGISNADLMKMHMYGNGVPIRNAYEFVNQAVKKAMQDKDLQDELVKYVTGEGTKEEFIGKLAFTVGQQAHDNVVGVIKAKNILLRNAPSTIAKKGRNYPLVDTGTMLKSLGWRVSG